MKNLYTVATKCGDFKQPNGELWWGVDGPMFGPDSGLDYYHNSLKIETEEVATIAAKIANIAYRTGYIQAQRDIQKALGLK